MLPSTKVTFGGALARPRSISSGTSSTATTSRTSGASAKAKAPVPAPASSARSSPVRGTKSRMRAASSSARRSCSAASRSAVAANRARVASCVLKSFLLGRDRASSALFGDLLEQPADLGPGRKLELATTDKRLPWLRLPGADYGVVEPAFAQERERLERPGLGRATDAADRPRRVVRRRVGPQSRAGNP